MDADRMPRPGPDETPLDDPITIDPVPDTSGWDSPIERGMGARMDGTLDDPGPGSFDGPAGMAGAGTDEVGQGSADRYLASDVGRGSGTGYSGDRPTVGRRDEPEVDLDAAFRSGMPRFDGTEPETDAGVRSNDPGVNSERMEEATGDLEKPDRPNV